MKPAFVWLTNNVKNKKDERFSHSLWFSDSFSIVTIILNRVNCHDYTKNVKTKNNNNSNNKKKHKKMVVLSCDPGDSVGEEVNYFSPDLSVYTFL